MQISTKAPRGHVTAVLGPTNTGKTHLAVERMLGHASGVMGFPLRLLAREVYDRVVAVKGPERVALMTGEEKIIPPFADYFLCTTESMPRSAGLGSRDFAFVGIDEIQMAADPERGHVFTGRMLSTRGTEETMLLGAGTMKPLVSQLIPKAEIVTRERFSELTYVAPKKLSRLPRRTALVAFSIEDVYAHAELLRRQKGGCAIVMGSLSPRTRNAQVELYQNGDVDYLVATDAIGMGLNMDIDTVVFASRRKFDGRKMRDLTTPEIAQIAGRAGRHMSSGSFTSLLRMEERSAQFSESEISAVEQHQFGAVKQILWRSDTLDFSSIDGLIRSLETPPGEDVFLRARYATDVAMLKSVASEKALVEVANTPERVKLLWDVCQIPDFRKLSGNVHARLLAQIFRHLLEHDMRLPDRWMHAQIDRLDNVSGDIDTLAQRIAAIRIWTFIANRPNWLENALYWSEVTRAIEDKLSDQLHERLTQRFVDKRTSILLRQLKEKGDLMTQIESAAPGQDDIVVEGHQIGTLKGFNFSVDSAAPREEQKMLRAAADKALRQELDRRAIELKAAKDGEFTLDLARGFGAPHIKWRGASVASVHKSDEPLTLHAKLINGAMLDGQAAEVVLERLNTFLTDHIAELLGPLVQVRDVLKAASKPGADVALGGQARAVAYQLVENLGILPRAMVDKEVRALDQVARRGLRQFKIRFGSTHIFIPLLLKPAPTDLRLILWALERGEDTPVVTRPTPGLVWIKLDKAVPRDFYRVAGFKTVGPHGVRIDMLERLADAVRPLGQNAARFTVSPDLMGYVGASGNDFEGVMQTLGYRHEAIEKEAWLAEQAAKQADAAQSDTPAPESEAAKANEAEQPEGPTAPEVDISTVAEPQTALAAEAAPDENQTPAEAAPSQETEPVANGEAPADDAAAAEPEMVTVYQWDTRAKRRPQKAAHGRGKKHLGRSDGAKQARPNKKGPRKGAMKGQGGKPGWSAGPGPKRGKESIDPDSPFAALAGLKDKLQNK